MKKILTIITTLLIISLVDIADISSSENIEDLNIHHRDKIIIPEDFDPLVDIKITIEIYKIRTLEKIDLFSDPDLYIKLSINGEEFESNIWHNQRYINDFNWSATSNVPDNEEFVNIKIQLWDWNFKDDKICDLSGTSEYEVNLLYNVKNGHWSGDDYLIGDPSGYGRLNGCDDGSIYKKDRDCELWFDIYQNDYDGDGIPYWTETYAFSTDPEIDNTGEDLDNDGIPIEWEYKWGFNPNIWDDHQNLDPDVDSLNNSEEYLTSSWDSDPFRRDIFLEMDIMDVGPKGETCNISDETKEMLHDAYHRRNIVFHLDDGCMGGGEIIPFDRRSFPKELLNIYNNFFLHNGTNNWRRGVFRYCLIIYRHCTASGIAYVGEKCYFNYWHLKGTNTFAISYKVINNVPKIKLKERIDFIFACVIMHELGHTFGIDRLFPLGCDNTRSIFPWQLGFWLFRNYKSCMSYRYVFFILDYSDGSHGIRDYDDWSNLDFTFFETKKKSSTSYC